VTNLPGVTGARPAPDSRDEIGALVVSNHWIDELPDGLLVCSTSGRITLVNQCLADMAGYSRDELVGQQLEVLVPPGARAAHPGNRAAFVAAHETRPMGLGMELRLARKDGAELPVEISLAPIGAPDSGVVAIVRDVSERLRAEAALRTTGELLALAHERERIARDLHDTVLQRLFGLGLELQAVAIHAGPGLSERVEDAVDEIDLIIREIRTAVFTLGSSNRSGSLGQELSAVVSQAKRVLGFAPRVRLDGPVETATTTEIQIELLASLREALTNVGRHAQATETEIEVQVSDIVLMRVLDNGRGVPADFDADSGNGLRNMAERARMLGGGCSVMARADQGTELRWWVPLPA
jgi:two-component system sensor histidine kinase DevS